TRRRSETKRLDVVRDLFDLGERERSDPAEPSRRRVVLPVTRGTRTHSRWLGPDLDVLVAWTDAGEALAERQQQPRVPFHPDLPANDRRDQATLLGQEAEPGIRVGGDVDAGLSDETLPDLDLAVLDSDRDLALLSPREREMEDGIETARLVRLENQR